MTGNGPNIAQSVGHEASPPLGEAGGKGDSLKGAAESGCSVAPLLWRLMIEIDDSELSEDDREFLQRWAEALEVPLGVLILRIVDAAIDGDQYIKMRPRD